MPVAIAVSCDAEFYRAAKVDATITPFFETQFNVSLGNFNCSGGRFCVTKYRKILIISPGLIFVQNAFLLGLSSGELIFGRGLLLEGILRFKMGWARQ